MTYCDNCGQPSHCGTDAKINVNAHEVGIYEVVACKHCRCEQCTKEKDKDNGV